MWIMLTFQKNFYSKNPLIWIALNPCMFRLVRISNGTPSHQNHVHTQWVIQDITIGSLFTFLMSIELSGTFFMSSCLVDESFLHFFHHVLLFGWCKFSSHCTKWNNIKHNHKACTAIVHEADWDAFMWMLLPTVLWSLTFEPMVDECISQYLNCLNQGATMA